MQTELAPVNVRLTEELGQLLDEAKAEGAYVSMYVNRDYGEEVVVFHKDELARFAAVVRAGERKRLRGYFREALADKGITWPGEVDGLYAKCFEEPDAHLNTPNVVVSGCR